MKETLFNVFGPDVNGALVLDVFGGSGAIGIEALSRDASQAVFIESSTAACRLIKKNLEICGIKSGYRIVQLDAFMALRSLAREGFRANLVFLDPPYEWRPYGDLLGIIFTRNLLATPSRVVIEHHRKASVPEAGSGYQRSRIIRQGDHCLSFFEESKAESSL